MYEKFIGKKLSGREIFQNFTDVSVVGKRVCFQNDDICIEVEFICSKEEAQKLFSREKSDRVLIHGKPSRKSEEVIWNSHITLKELVGPWNTSVTVDGGMSNVCLVLKSDGTGLIAEANMGPYFETLITWYVEEDILHIHSDKRSICAQKINYTPDVIVPCMSREERHFTQLEGAPYGLTFFRDILDNTVEEWDISANRMYDYVCNDTDD